MSLFTSQSILSPKFLLILLVLIGSTASSFAGDIIQPEESSPAAIDFPNYYFSAAPSDRVDSVSIALGGKLYNSFYAETAFIDEGKQPDGIKNINRVVNADLVQIFSIKSFSISLKAGLSTSYFSHNGSGNDYTNHTGFVGENVGLSVTYPVTENLSVGFYDYVNRYLQCDHRAFETFNLPAVGLQFNL